MMKASLTRRTFLGSTAAAACAAGSAAIALAEEAASPADGAAAAEQAENWWDVYPVDWEENFVDLDTGITMCYMTAGPEDGTPVMLVHGTADSRMVWAQVVPHLVDAGMRVYVPEMRGQGKTDKPFESDHSYDSSKFAKDIASLFDKLGLEHVHMVGHSLGSLTCQIVAAQSAEVVETVTLISTGAIMGTGQDQLDYLIDQKTGEVDQDFIQSWSASSNDDADFVHAQLLQAQALPTLSWLFLFHGTTSDYTEYENAITCPVQIIWGTEDALFSSKDQDDVQERLTNAASVDFHAIDGASHGVFTDSAARAEEVSGLIVSFVEGAA